MNTLRIISLSESNFRPADFLFNPSSLQSGKQDFSLSCALSSELIFIKKLVLPKSRFFLPNRSPLLALISTQKEKSTYLPISSPHLSPKLQCFGLLDHKSLELLFNI